MKVGDKVYLPDGTIGIIERINHPFHGDPLAPPIAVIEVPMRDTTAVTKQVRLDLLKLFEEKPKPVEERVNEELHSLENNIEKLQTAIFNGKLEDVDLDNQNDMLVQLYHMKGYARELRKRYERMRSNGNI